MSGIRGRELSSQDIYQVRQFESTISGLGVRNEAVGVDTVPFRGLKIFFLGAFTELRKPIIS